jgi:hypothetical protein
MMGIQETPARLFYDFCLEEHVPVDHVLRGIDRHLALDDLRQSLKPFYSQMGRPSVDPELMIRVLIIGYCMASGPNVGCVKRLTSIWPIAALPNDFRGRGTDSRHDVSSHSIPASSTSHTGCQRFVALRIASRYCVMARCEELSQSRAYRRMRF